MRFWHVARWIALVLFLVIITLVLVRGPEDTWLQASNGTWVAHGHPAGPAPSEAYQPPLLERIGPALFLLLLMSALAAVVFLSGRAPAGSEYLNQSIRYFGAVSIACTFAGISLAVALVVGLSFSPGSPIFVDQTVIVLSLVAVILTAKLLSWHSYTTKKVLEAHYDLKRSVQLLQETMEQLRKPPEG